MTTVHLIGGEKGGTGKSWVFRVLDHSLTHRNQIFHSIKTDVSSAIYRNICDDARLLPLTMPQTAVAMADEAFKLALTGDVIINLPPQVHQHLHHWIEQFHVNAQAQKHDISIKQWWISDGEDESLQLFLNSLQTYRNDFQHVFVKNHGRSRSWNYFERHQEIQEAIHHYQIPVVEFPVLSEMRRLYINHNRLTFAMALQVRAFGVVGRHQIAQYLQAADAVFDAAGAFA
jgi:hypothetical protein